MVLGDKPEFDARNAQKVTKGKRRKERKKEERSKKEKDRRKKNEE